MNPQEIAQTVYDNNTNQKQFALANIPFHTHTGLDSNKVDYQNLDNKSIVLAFTLFGTQAATAGNYSVFFTAPYAMTLTSITEVHTVLGTGGACTVGIDKLTGTAVPRSGGGADTATAKSLLITPFNLVGTINTVVTGTLVTAPGLIQLAAGNRLAFNLTGTPTSVANVTVTLILNF